VPGCADPSCPVHVAWAGGVSLSAPAPRGRLARPPSPMGCSDSREAVGFPSLRWGPPPCSTGRRRSPRRCGSGLRLCRGCPVRGARSVCLAIAALASAWAAQDPLGPPQCLTPLSTPPTLFVDPDRPSGISPTRSLGVGFWGVHTLAVCVMPTHGAVSRVRECALPGGLRGSLGPLQPCRSAVRCLLHRCNTRYAWWVRPSSAGTLTLPEAPSFA
jgi:hypothetical protein